MTTLQSIEVGSCEIHGMCELTAEEIFFVSGGIQLNDSPGTTPVFNFLYGIFKGASVGGVTGALGGYLNGTGWASGGLTGMAVGGVSAGLNYKRPPQ